MATGMQASSWHTGLFGRRSVFLAVLEGANPCLHLVDCHESRPSADDDDKTTSIDTVTDSISKLSVNPSRPVSTPLAEPSAITTTTESQKDSSEAGSKVAVTKVPAKEEDKEEELSPEEAKLRAKGLKSTHRPGFYIHMDAPRRLRIQTSTTTFDLDRYCPHANADMLKWASSNIMFL
ncbi:unnamed protein product [Mortierella alpina]